MIVPLESHAESLWFQYLQLLRAEVCQRKVVEEQEKLHFEDCKFNATLILRRFAGQKRGKSCDDVWFPVSPIREVHLTTRQVHRHLPERPSRDMLNVVADETGVRQWMEGIEARRRFDLAQYLHDIQLLAVSAVDLEHEQEAAFIVLIEAENKHWKHLRQREFRDQPIALAKLIATNKRRSQFEREMNSCAASEKSVPIDEIEVLKRSDIEIMECGERRTHHDVLQLSIAVQLFSLTRVEDGERVAIFDEERHDREIVQDSNFHYV